MVQAKSRPEPYLTTLSNGRSEVESDADLDKGGGAQGFRPHEFLEAALASCLSITLRMAAEKFAFPLESSSVEVRLDRTGPGGPVFRQKVELRGPLTDGQRERLLEALERCPVRRTLSQGFRFE